MTVGLCISLDCAEHTFEIFLAEVEQDNSNVSPVILINHSSYSFRQFATSHQTRSSANGQQPCEHTFS